MIEILYEDRDIIVVVKPWGVSSQTERGSSQDMVSMLMNHFYENGEKNPYVGVVHRLDKNVSGVMVYGKNKGSTGKLCGQISGKGFTKKYYGAIYNGDRLPAEGRMEDILVRDGQHNISRVTDNSHRDGKKAELLYKILSDREISGHIISFVDVTLLTGRHHQIRVQFSSRGCPLVGDRKYNKSCVDEIRMANIGLHCYRLGFIHPVTGKKLEFFSKPSEGIFEKAELR